MRSAAAASREDLQRLLALFTKQGRAPAPKAKLNPKPNHKPKRNHNQSHESVGARHQAPDGRPMPDARRGEKLRRPIDLGTAVQRNHS